MTKEEETVPMVWERLAAARVDGLAAERNIVYRANVRITTNKDRL